MSALTITVNGSALTIQLGTLSPAVNQQITQAVTNSAASAIAAANSATAAEEAAASINPSAYLSATPGSVAASNLASGAAASNVGALSGDLTGSLPNPTVSKVGGHGVAQVIAQSGVAASVTSTTTETTLATITIPANAMGASGRIRVTMGWSSVATASHTLRVRLAGTAMMMIASASVSYVLQCDIVSQNSQQSQIALPIGVVSSGTSAPVTSAVNMTAAQTLTITAAPGATTETVTLYWYSVEVLNP